MTLRRTSDDGMGTVDVTAEELASMAALDVSEAVEVLRGHARVRVSMNGRHNALYAARDLLQLAPAMAAELRARSSRAERIEAAARALIEAIDGPEAFYADDRGERAAALADLCAALDIATPMPVSPPRCDCAERRRIALADPPRRT